jgi:putative hydrolase of the HAD superfamily
VPPPYRACLIDALGTIVRLEPPWLRIDPGLVAGIPPERVEAAFRCEMNHYRANAERARDRASLAALRVECAGLLTRELGREVGVTALMDAIAFDAYPDARPALEAVRGAGLDVVCVSNWDYELPEVLARIGLAPVLDGVVTSAELGIRKPDPRIFARALEIAGCGPEDAFHVGDGPEDVDGAHAAGIAAIRIDRGSEDGAGVVASLTAIAEPGAPIGRMAA